jgi:hypothetical protein
MWTRVRLGGAMKMRQLVAAILRNHRTAVRICAGETRVVYLRVTPYAATRRKPVLPADRFRGAPQVAWRLPTNLSPNFPTD